MRPSIARPGWWRPATTPLRGCRQTTVTPAKVQAALESLRQRQPSMVWKSARSEYAVDDAAMHRWYTQRINAQTWPPVGAQQDWSEE